MNRNIIYFFAFLAGVILAGIFFTGVRILIPFSGLTSYLLTVIVSVIFLFFSIGIFAGTWRGRKRQKINILPFLPAAAGLFLILIPLFKTALFNLLDSYDPVWSIPAAAIVLFAPPVFFTGTAAGLAQKNETVIPSGGYFSAASALGAVISSLLTGYILPAFAGSNSIFIFLGVLILLWPALVFYRSKQKGYFIILFCAAAPLSYFSFSAADASQGNSFLGITKVIQIKENRLLQVNDKVIYSTDPFDPGYGLRYPFVFDIAKKFFNYSGDLLLIGTGGGAVLNSYCNDNWDVDAAEINPDIAEAAYKHLGMNTLCGIINITDGRAFLRSTGKKYELILVDAFAEIPYPAHLLTKEAFQTAKYKLKRNGIIGINIKSKGWEDITVKSIAATLKSEFKYVQVLPIAEPPDQPGNIVLFASDSEPELKKSIERNHSDPDYRYSPSYEQAHSWDNKFVPNLKQGVIITDNYNPLEWWQEK